MLTQHIQEKIQVPSQGREDQSSPPSGQGRLVTHWGRKPAVEDVSHTPKQGVDAGAGIHGRGSTLLPGLSLVLSQLLRV